MDSKLSTPSTAGEIRWVCLLPDPVTGLDQPVQEVGSQKPKVWVAPNREYAIRLIRADLLPNAFRLASVISHLDWTERQRIPQRPKLATVPIAPGKHRGFRNPKQTCWHCGGRTPTPDSNYCDAHRSRKRRRSA